jgi:hypothetical protein
VTDYGITPPPLTGWQAPAAQPEPIDWAYRDHIRMTRLLAAGGHPDYQAVVAYHGWAPLPAPAPPPPALPSAAASVPQTPRAPVPTAPQPTPALAGISRRTEVLSSLLGRPTPVAPTDKLV